MIGGGRFPAGGSSKLFLYAYAVRIPVWKMT
jgi:hypothetical protein